jgi:hypothetical protein
MQNYLEEQNFIDDVIETGKIKFVVHGNLTCQFPINFKGDIFIHPPTVRVKANHRDKDKESEINLDKVHFRDLEGETVFRGEMLVKERNLTGIGNALDELELWADMLCLAHGNPKIHLEIQLPIRVISATRRDIELQDIREWHRFEAVLGKLPKARQDRIKRALWWYRKGCSLHNYSIFDTYTAFWNVLEIVCAVSGNLTRKGTDIDEAVQKYLASKKKITAGDISHCYNSIVKYGIPEQMKDALIPLLNSSDEADQWVYYCFKVKPDKDRFYQIRNDINHGNISATNTADLRRVYLRGMILQDFVFCCLNRILGVGLKFTSDGDIHQKVRHMMNTPDGDISSPVFR